MKSSPHPISARYRSGVCSDLRLGLQALKNTLKMALQAAPKVVLLSTAVGMVPAFAQTASSTPAVDPTLFQTTSFVRFTSPDSRASEDFGVIPARTLPFQILDPLTFKPVIDPFTGSPRMHPAKMYLYEARNPLAKIAVSGSNYAVLSDRTLVTFSAIWDKPLPKGKLDADIEVYGGVYLIKRGTREIITVNSTGYVNFGTTVIAPAARLYGGNFFIDRDNDLWTVDHKGLVYNASKIMGQKFPGATLAGGNYFVQQDGTLVTVASTGLPLPAFVPNSKPSLSGLGGNYYIGEDGVVYTIGYDGSSFVGPKLAQRTKHLGYSYVILADNTLGRAHRDIVRVESTKTKYQMVTKIPDALDSKSVYTPNSRK
jgi:hypothetical protein